MNCLRWYGSIARLTKRAAPLITINCAAIDELRNIWSIAQRTCNRVRVKVMTRVRGLWSGLGYRVSFKVTLGGLGPP